MSFYLNFDHYFIILYIKNTRARHSLPAYNKYSSERTVCASTSRIILQGENNKQINTKKMFCTVKSFCFTLSTVINITNHSLCTHIVVHVSEQYDP